MYLCIGVSVWDLFTSMECYLNEEIKVFIIYLLICTKQNILRKEKNVLSLIIFLGILLFLCIKSKLNKNVQI